MMPVSILPTHLDYLHALTVKNAEPLNIRQYLNKHPWLEHYLLTGSHMLFAFSFTEKRYLFMTPNVLHVMGHPAEAFAEGGFVFTSHIFGKEEFRIYNEHIFRTNLDTLKKIAPAEHKHCQVIFTFKVKDRFGKWLHLQQQSAYIQSDEKGNPLISFGIVTDISPYKKDSRMLHQINYLGKENTRSLISRFYHPDQEQGLLSKREKEVLKWMAEGFTSKEIAYKLHLSMHTVNTHRSNMLAKTGALNTADLLTYAGSHLLV